jgi:DnaJ-class molecular chaperone
MPTIDLFRLPDATPAPPVQSTSPAVKCRGCNGHGLLGNILDTSTCHFCDGTGIEPDDSEELQPVFCKAGWGI